MIFYRRPLLCLDYLFYVFACFGTDLLEKHCIYWLAVGFSFFFRNFSCLLQIQFWSNQEENRLFMNIFFYLTHPHTQFLVRLSLIDRVEKQNCSHSFVVRFHNRSKRLLPHLLYYSKYCIPNLQLDWILLVDLHIFGEILDSCGDLVVICKFVIDIFLKKRSLANSWMCEYVPEGPISSTLNFMISSFLSIWL